jgi:hypothetical protein
VEPQLDGAGQHSILPYHKTSHSLSVNDAGHPPSDNILDSTPQSVAIVKRHTYKLSVSNPSKKIKYLFTQPFNNCHNDVTLSLKAVKFHMITTYIIF